MIKLELIFAQISLKLQLNITNSTNYPLLSDSLNKDIKLYILQSVLAETKTLFINLIYYKSHRIVTSYKMDRILQLLVVLVQKKILQELSFLKINVNYSSPEAKWLLKNLEMEDGELIKWVFDKLFVQATYPEVLDVNSYSLLMAIIENLILKLTEIISYLLLMELHIEPSILAENVELDLLIINTQKNNLYWNSYIKNTFLKPKNIYSGIYNLKIIRFNGFCDKLIYLPNLKVKEKKYLSTLQFIVLMYLEAIDFFYPKVKWIWDKFYLKLN